MRRKTFGIPVPTWTNFARLRPPKSSSLPVALTYSCFNLYTAFRLTPCRRCCTGRGGREGGAVAEKGARWPSGLERWTGDRTVQGSNPTAENFSLRNFGNSVYPALPVSFGGDTKSRRSLLSGVCARGSKRSHQSALECVTVVDYIAHSKLPQKCVYAAENAALH